MGKVWLGLGSNLGDSRQILQRAWEELAVESSIRLLKLSSPYASDPVGMDSKNRFLNAVGTLETDLDPQELLAVLQKVEKRFGRDKKTGTEGYQDRLLDLDILYYDELLSKTGNLQIPHPHIANRLFVLAPLAELDPDHCDPGSKKRAEEMLSELLQDIEHGAAVAQKIQRQTWNRED